MSYSSKHTHLYNISIEELDLSSKALIALKKVGIISIGDCIDFFVRSYINYPRPFDTPHANLAEMYKEIYEYNNSDFTNFMFVEVEQKLKDYNYWSFVEINLKK